MLHASETWPVTKPCLQRQQLNDRAMLRQTCNVKPQDTATIRSIELLARLRIKDLDLILKERRLRWYGHVERSNGAVKTAFDIQVNGKPGFIRVRGMSGKLKIFQGQGIVREFHNLSGKI